MIKHVDYFEANKDLWNQGTYVNKDSAFYNLPGFKKGATLTMVYSITAVKQ